MKIKEAARQVGITPKNIRFYEQEGLLSPERNRENGYRDYGPEDIGTLRRIKLMRKLGLSLEEIRHMQEGRLTLPEGMRRHLATLDRQERDLAAARRFSTALLEQGGEYAALDADSFLREMELSEKEGTVFVNKQREDHRIKSTAAIAAACVVSLFMLALIGVFVWTMLMDPIPVWVFLIVILPLAAMVIGTFLALYQRLMEIKGGEEDAARNY